MEYDWSGSIHFENKRNSFLPRHKIKMLSTIIFNSIRKESEICLFERIINESLQLGQNNFKKRTKLLIWEEKNIGPVPSKDIQTLAPLNFAPIFMKDAHSAESNEKSFFRCLQFLFFELWLHVFTIYPDFI